MARRIAAATAAWMTLVCATALAAAPVQPYGTDDPGHFWGIIPPGEAGVANAVQAAQFLSGGTYPPHFTDQRGMYTDLLYATPGLKQEDIGKYFKDATFGVKPEDVERTETPRDDVTIVRDKQFGVPHIYATTRSGAMFGEGYAAAEDRLFLMDVLRHYGSATLSSFAGGANVSTDEEQWAGAPYTDADLQKQIDELPQLLGADGAGVVQDATDYVAGINAYISEAKLDVVSKVPAEYAAIGRPMGPDPWTLKDLISTASLIGGQLGNGGGDELTQMQLLQADIKRFGAKKGIKVWTDFRAEDDPEAPVTATAKKGFPYDQIPKKSPLKYAALADPGTLQTVADAVDKSGSAAAARGTGPFEGLLHFPTVSSNALLVGRKLSATGHPLVVFGSQAGYFAPEIYMEQDVHGPGIETRGASFPGVSLYVELGRGRDYAWSATSASQDIIDVYAVDLCQDDVHYLYRGQCLPMEKLTKTISWSPSAADTTAPGSETLVAYRTKLGILVARAKIGGKPVGYVKLRSTYFHEIDSAAAFRDWNDPDKVHNASDFMHSAFKLGYTFNWFYTDDRDIAYINTGANPQRPKGVNGLLPIRYSPRTIWKGFSDADNTMTQQPYAQRPQAINQPFLTSWNNKQAQHCCGGSEYTPLWRSQLLDDQIRSRLSKGKMTLPGLIDSAEVAASQDLRGWRMLPWALRVLGTSKDPQLAGAETTLKAWVAHGAHRLDKDRDGHYDDADAVRIMDAWMTTLPKAVFGPGMGDALYKLYDAHHAPDVPNSFHSQAHAHLGSSWEEGWFGFLQKDLRTVLKRKVRGKYSRVWCGNGSLARCRTALESSLRAALAVPASQLYDDPTVEGKCGTMDQQACYDAIRYRPLGAVTQPLEPWQNRPTQQQVVEVLSHRPR